MNDIVGKLINRIDYWKLNSLGVIQTIIMKVIAKARGVTIGQYTRFWGMMYFRRKNESIISIGSFCRFRSSKLSNLVGLNRKCIISTHQKNAVIKIGDDCGFSGTVIGCANSVYIGNNVLCGGNTFITDFDWHPINRNVIDPVVQSAPIVIENNVWLGLNTIVLKGVTIGENSVIGANSIVVKSIPPNVIAAGNPCKIIKNL